MIEKHVMMVSRSWDHPEIRIDIIPENQTCKACGCSMHGVKLNLEDFVRALVEEDKSHQVYFSRVGKAIDQSQKLEWIRSLALIVVDKLKAEIARVITP